MGYLDEMFGLEGKIALVTGGSRGIGLMIAEGLVRAGAKVYISSRKADVCEQVAKELSSFGQCLALPADLSTEGACIDLAARLGEVEEELHILVNNAGANWGEDYRTFPASAWDKVLDLNVKSIFYLTRECTPLLQAAGTRDDPARVINIGSVDGMHAPVLETYSYSTSKAAVHSLSTRLAKKLAPEVTVNAIAPGPFESKMMQATLEAFGDAIAQQCPLKRIGRPEDMAGVAIWLCSKAGSYVTGDVIPVDGGLVTTL